MRPGKIKEIRSASYQTALRYCAIKHVDNLTVFENHDRRILRIPKRLLNSRSASVFTFKSALYRYALARHLQKLVRNYAGAAPRCPEVDHHR